ncbi:3-ketoacyl-ACP reductase [Mycobacterium sp. IS-1742]|uniref:mycofactocin-coupled SDR family oxidoreductase n=1 Tax=Mycobacterium sp. IS-1742 TaxID=1772285 RepID=UPI0007402D92|nr:mycofactocin-coupled SDR family oxidoreductase [Mycobacterium sp. IS-1742]KUI32120.1 3-ketoacyl-ACP reductase [Mycobacterium sp. IS-1742]
MGDLDHTVALVTGAARGQGRSHAVALAAEGADIIAIDRCADIESIPYPLATKEDLDETAELVRATGRQVVTVIADVRDLADLQAAVQTGTAELGELDIVVANAGVVAIGLTDPTDERLYRDIVDINLNGVWHTIAATAPSIIRKGRGGSIILTSSMQGLVGRGGDGSAAMFAYAASKHGVVGLMRSAANAYAPHNIRVNSVHPTGVGTPMILNEHMATVFAANPTSDAMAGNLLPVPYVEPEDVANAVVWLAGPKARYITGTALPVDAGHAAM